MTAKLVIEADSSPLRRFFSDITESSRRTSEAMKSHFTKFVGFFESELKDMRQANAKALAEMDADYRKFEESMTQKARQGNQAREQFHGGYRDNAFQEEEKAAEESQRKITGIYRRGSESRRSLLKQEAEERKKLFAGIGEGVINAGINFASQMYDKSQDARERRAIIQAQIADPLGQAGAGFAEVDATTDRIRQFAVDNKIKATDISTALGNYQTTYSGLGDSKTDAATRSKNLDKFLSLAVYSRDVGLGVEEGTSLAGEMSRQGVTDEGLVKQVLNATSAIGQYGSVAAKDALSQGKGPLVTRIKRAVAEAQQKGITGAGLEAVVVNTVKEVMTEFQMAAGSGENVGTAGVNMKNLQGALNSFVRGGKLSNNIDQTKLLDKNQKKALLAALFQTDKHGNIIKDKLKDGLNDPAAFAAAWTGAVGTDPKLIGLLEGGGHGNAMSITGPQRKMLEYLVGADIHGKTGWQFMRSIQDAQLSDKDVARQKDIAEHLDANVMQAEKEQGDINARPGTNGTSLLQEWGDKAATLARENPAAASLLGIGGAALGKVAVSQGGGLLGRALSAMAPRAGAGLLGNAARVLGPIGVAAGILLDSNESIMSGDEEAARLKLHQRWGKLDRGQQRSVADLLAEQTEQGIGGNLGKMSGNVIRQQFETDPNLFVVKFAQAIAQALERAKITATIDPHAAEQTRSASQGQQTRTPVQ